MEGEETKKWKSIKLTYFNLNSRAAVIRAILTYSKVKFEEERIEMKDWAEVKKKGLFEFDQVPVLEIDGEQYTQMFALNIFLAETFNLHGKTLREKYLIESLMSSFFDFYPKMRCWILPIYGNEKDYIEENKIQAENNWAPFFLKVWEKRLKDYGGKYFVGDNFTVADIFVTVFIYSLFYQPARKNTWSRVVTDEAPNLAVHVEKIANNELFEYFDKVFISNAIV
jgi:glutathione S-transferase